MGYLHFLEAKMNPSDIMKTSPQGGGIKNTPIACPVPNGQTWKCVLKVTLYGLNSLCLETYKDKGIYNYIHIRTQNQLVKKKAMNLKEIWEGYMMMFEWRKMKGEM